MCFKRFRCARIVSGRLGYVIGEQGRDVIFVIVDLGILAIIIASKLLALIIQLLTGSDLFSILIRIILDCKLGTITHIEKRPVLVFARVLYLAAIKIKGDIAIALIEIDFAVVLDVLHQLETGGLTHLNALKFTAKFFFVSYFPGSRSSLLVFRNRSNGFTIRSRCTLVLLLFLGLSLRLCIVSGLVALGLVTILVFGIPVVSVVYTSRLT